MSVLPLFLFLPFLQGPDLTCHEALQALSGKTDDAIIEWADTPSLALISPWENDLRHALENGPAAQKLYAARVLARFGHYNSTTNLLPLLQQEPFAAGVLGVFAMEGFRLQEEVQLGLAEWLQDPSQSDLTPRHWAEGCRILYQQGDGARRRAAVRWLKMNLSASAPALATASLLALARTGATLETESTIRLEALAQGVGRDAELAQSLTHGRAQQERFRRKLEALERLYQNQLEENSEGLESSELAIFKEVLELISTRHMEGAHIDKQDLLGAAADGMLRRMDPYSTYFTGTEAQEFLFDLHPEYGGIGAYVNTVDGVFTLIRPIYSGPAYKVGLLSGDKILAVDGWSTSERPNDEIIKRLKGPPGTEVVVEIFRRGWSKPRDFKMERGKIEIPVVQAEMLPGKVLYMELLGFSLDAADRVQEEIESALANSPLTGVVLDLRNNPGGSLDAAVGICDLFLPSGKTVVTTRSRMGEVERLATESPAVISAEIPLTILVNEFSASASEIVSGALSIHGRALTVGERTHGKGSVQTLIRLRGKRDERFEDRNRDGIRNDWEKYRDANGNGQYDFGPRVKMTIAYYFLPDGSTIHTQRDEDGKVTQLGGVEPDISIAFTQYSPVILRELDRLIGEERFADFADQVVAFDSELAIQLATYDRRDPQMYPGWEDFFSSLETFLDGEVVRQWVHRRLRDKVADLRGQVFPGNGFLGDFLADPQLAEAIRQVLQAAGSTIAEVPEYASTLVPEVEVLKNG